VRGARASEAMYPGLASSASPAAPAGAGGTEQHGRPGRGEQHAAERPEQDPPAGEQRPGGKERQSPPLGGGRLATLLARAAQRGKDAGDGSGDLGPLEDDERLPAAEHGARAGRAGEERGTGHAAAPSRAARPSLSAARQYGRSSRHA